MKGLYFATLASLALFAQCETSVQDTSVQDAPIKESESMGKPPLQQQPEESASPTTTCTGSATPVDCLAAFNDARAAAGLPSFVSAGTEFRVEKPDDNDKKFFKDVCQALMTQTPVTQTDNSFNRTIALAVQDGTEGDCAAAVTHFNGALSLFGDLPPAFSTDSGSVYKKLQAVSFVALYNPKENPKLDCGYFTCTKSLTQATTTKPGTESIKKGADDADSSPANETITTTLHGLLCASSPPALVAGQAPFEQETYDKIKAAISSASSAMPAFIALLLAGASFFLY